MGARLLNEQLGARELVAPTPWGAICLTTPWGGEADSDGLIQQLTLWCQQPLTFTPVSDPAQCEQAAVVRGVVSDMRLAPVGTEVVLPLALLKSMPPPLPLQGAAMTWPKLTFQVTVASLDESAIEPSHVQEGGMMLLPQAFQSPWVVRLHAGDVSCTLWGHLQLNAGVIDLVPSVDVDGLNEDDAPALDSAWRVHLARSVVLDLPVAMGWIKGARAVSVDYSCDLGSLSEFGLSAELRHPQRGLMLSGMVVPVMLGAALCVRAVHTDF